MDEILLFSHDIKKENRIKILVQKFMGNTILNY